LIASVKSDPIDLPKIEKAVHKAGDSVKRRRQCFFKGKFMDTPIYDGTLLIAGTHIQGHAIVEGPTSTIVIPAGFCLQHRSIRQSPSEERDPTMKKVDPITLSTTWHFIQRVCREMRETAERTATNVLVVTAP